VLDRGCASGLGPGTMPAGGPLTVPVDTGRCLIDLNQPRRAHEQITEGVTLLPKSRDKTKAVFLAYQAGSALKQGEVRRPPTWPAAPLAWPGRWAPPAASGRSATCPASSRRTARSTVSTGCCTTWPRQADADARGRYPQGARRHLRGVRGGVEKANGGRPPHARDPARTVHRAWWVDRRSPLDLIEVPRCGLLDLADSGTGVGAGYRRGPVGVT